MPVRVDGEERTRKERGGREEGERKERGKNEEGEREERGRGEGGCEGHLFVGGRLEVCLYTSVTMTHNPNAHRSMLEYKGRRGRNNDRAVVVHEFERGLIKIYNINNNC